MNSLKEKITPKFWGKVINGHLSLNNRQNFISYTSKLKGEVYLTVGQIKSTRTLNQNNYYWLYLNILEDETGDNANDLHEFFKRKFLRPRMVKILGQEMKLPATTTNLTKLEFGEYLDKIEQLTNIPLPDVNKI